MPVKRFANICRVNSTTSGTGTLTLTTAVSGYLTPALAGLADGTVVTYSIRDGSDTEHGTGTYNSAGPTLTRTTVFNSTNAGSKISCSGSQQVAITPAAQDLPQWFNVLAYGATGDGSTDDTTAVNLAIAALNTATHGVLYFPSGTYKCTAALTAITAFATIMGDSEGTASGSTGSMVTCTSATAVLFTTNTLAAKFYNLQVRNTSGAASAGSGVAVTNAASGPKVDFENFKSISFYDGIDIQQGGNWIIENVTVNALRYGVRVRNTVDPDAGDWTITNSKFTCGSLTSGTAGIRIESSGGGKITNCKINQSGSNQFEAGIDLTTTASTSILLIMNCSIENIAGHGIKIVTSGGAAAWNSILITGCQFGLFGNSTGNAINFNCGTLGDINNVVIAGNSFQAGTASYAISLTKLNDVRVYGNINKTFGSLMTNSGCTSVYNATTAVQGTYTDHIVARFDGVTSTEGRVLEGSLVTIDDSGGINIPTGQTYNINSVAHTHAESAITFTDIATNDVSTTKHGYVPKAPNDAAKFLRGDATWATGGGGGSGFVANDSIWDAKGNIAAATGADAASVLAVGANGTYLAASSGAATGLAWTVQDGWIDGSTYTWVYASATTFTIAGVDLTTTFTKGTKVKWTQTTVKYGVVASSSFSTNTTVTLIATTDYAVTNAAISANYYSYVVNPQGFPTVFNYTATYTGFSADPTSLIHQWWTHGNIITVYIVNAASGTSNTNAFTISAPVAAVTLTNHQWGNWARCTDNSATVAGMIRILSAGTVMTLIVGVATTWTTSGGKACQHATLSYQF